MPIKLGLTVKEVVLFENVSLYKLLGDVRTYLKNNTIESKLWDLVLEDSSDSRNVHARLIKYVWRSEVKNV